MIAAGAVGAAIGGALVVATGAARRPRSARRARRVSEQIGSELGGTRQAAWEFMQRRIAEHNERTPPPDDAA
jgi:hypothetical protein